jgi:uncharacterized protein (DUF58 family)
MNRVRREAGTRRSQRPVALPPSAPPPAVAAKAALLRRLELDVTRRLDGMLSGDYLAFSAGPGTEPAGARPYGPGDDARRIDWSLTARSLDLHVRTTEAERELETCVVVDRSASLDFGTAEREKREVALAVTAAFGFLTVRAGNRLSVVVAGGEGLIRLPARNGRSGVLAALSAIYETPRREGPPASGADLRSALARVERTQQRRGQVVVVSDFLESSDWPMMLRRLALRHQVIAAHIADPRELELPPVGMLAVVDVETGRHLDVQTNSPRLRERFAAAAIARQEQIRRSIVEAGAEYFGVATDRDWLLDVATFIGQRRHRRMSQVSRARQEALNTGQGGRR